SLSPLAAQTVDVNGINAEKDGATTIRIEKSTGPNTATTTTTTTPQWEVHDGTADIEGDTSATPAEAKKAWKKACKQWQKEFRADNKYNKIISLSCGSADCSGEAGNEECTSTANY